MAADHIEAMSDLFVPRDPESLERYCKEKLDELQREYTERCKPYIDVLVKIEMTKPPKPIYMKISDTTYYLAQYPKEAKDDHHPHQE
jgi:hypothetical protein